MEFRYLTLKTTNESNDARPLGFSALFLCRDLIGQQISLSLQSDQHAGINFPTVCRDLASFDGQERLFLFNLLSLLHINLFDRALLKREDLCGPGGGRQIANHRLLSGVRCEEEEDDDKCNARRN